jgi:hypothetical protein
MYDGIASVFGSSNNNPFCPEEGNEKEITLSA